MEKLRFEKLLKNNKGLILFGKFVLFADLELFNKETKTSKKYNNIDEFYNDVYLGETFENHILNMDDYHFIANGGRGSGSESTGQKKWERARSGGNGGGSAFSKYDYPARLNTMLSGAKRNQKQMIKAFTDKYGDADHEYGASIDMDGFAHNLIEGGRSAVIADVKPNTVFIHNHPSHGYANFSLEDLENTALQDDAKGIIATSKGGSDRGTFTFMKTAKFDAKGFVKALNKATYPDNLGYNEGVDYWLKANAKKYGYKYETQGWKPNKPAKAAKPAAKKSSTKAQARA